VQQFAALSTTQLRRLGIADKADVKALQDAIATLDTPNNVSHLHGL
jgi:hypothetical protein